MRKILLCILTILCFSSIAYAENLAAEKYRNLFNDGRVAIQFKTTHYGDKGKKQGWTIEHNLYLYNGQRSATRKDREFGDGFALFKKNDISFKNLYQYRNGDIYCFFPNKIMEYAKLDAKKYLTKELKKANAAWCLKYNIDEYRFTEYNIINQLNSNYISDYAEEAYPFCCLPEELTAIYNDDLPYTMWVDKMLNVALNRTSPIFIESTKKKIKDIEYDCDRYVVTCTNEDGSLVDELAYDLLYKGDNLIMSQKYSLTNGERLMLEHNYTEISSNVDVDHFKIDKPLIVFVYNHHNSGMGELVNNNKGDLLKFDRIIEPAEWNK